MKRGCGFDDGLCELSAMSLSNMIGVLLTAFIVTMLCAIPVAFSQDSADSVVTIVKDDAIQISNIDDWDFGILPVQGVDNAALRFEDNMCVFSSTGSYSLTIDSLTSINRLRLTGDSGDTIRFNLDVRFSNGGGTSTQRAMAKGTTINNMTGSSTLGCTDVGNSNLQLTSIVNRGQFNRAAPGVYTDVVILLVTPE